MQGKNADNLNNILFMRIERKRNLQRLSPISEFYYTLVVQEFF